ncbi:MAG: TetR/AcrR family transcriptional regulator [Ilumatobacter sp.]|uniref:TetR/AcrR family transcriptional regulator n=1 Tax=Ilumatobacter sp. TaxID=1967498 RepID=UPI00261B7B0F|nr:TetR/AcrR family transcriptional regulator [Ilumatobacter sp.]MDJ0768583.1 TetR/AcrR family transcriptional regulator [Ilumatobacter sp.]
MARPPKFDDHEILDRAMTALWQGGWSQTSIRDLEGALELKAPSIYRRFGTKEGLGTAVVDHYVDRVVRRRVDKHLTGEGDPIDNLTAFLESSVTQSGDGGRLWGCLLTTTSLEADDPGRAFADALRTGLEVIEHGLQREVYRAAELDRLAPGVEPDAAAATLTLVMQGLMALARGGAPPADLRRRARAAVATIAGGCS